MQFLEIENRKLKASIKLFNHHTAIRPKLTQSESLTSVPTPSKKCGQVD